MIDCTSAWRRCRSLVSVRRGADLRGSTHSIRAINAFCWLPPDRCRCSGEPDVLIPSRAMSSVTTGRRAGAMNPQRLTRGSAINTMLSRTDIVGMMPSALRSSGRAAPAASDDRGEPVRTVGRRSSAAAVEALRPEDRLHRLRAPRASKPARPSTSPARTDSDTSTSWCRRVSPLRRAAPRRAPAGRVAREPSARTSAMSRPSIVAITSSLVVSVISWSGRAGRRAGS